MNDLINSILSAEPFDMKELRGHESWKWYGFAGHHIVSSRCAYHLCTKVGDYLISTVGAFYQRPSDNHMTPIGAADEFYETFVFDCPREFLGDPQISFYEIDSVRYTTSQDAEKGHYTMCWKYHENPS